MSITNTATCEETKAACVLVLKSVQGGVTMELQGKKVSGTGSIQNSVVGEENIATGTGVLTLEEVTVVQPAGKGCEVEGGKVTTSEIALTTAGQGMFIRLEPKSGSVIAAYKIKGCSVSPLNKEYKVEGSVKGTPNGATVGFTHAGTTEQGTFTIGGQKAGIAAQLTFSGRTEGGAAFTPLATTTAGEPEKGLFAATAYPATLSGNQTVQHALAVGTKEIECTELLFPGTLTAESSTVAISPEYKGCRADLKLPVTATMNGCSYVLGSPGSLSISCPAGKKIQYHVFESEAKHAANEALCTYSVPAQGPVGKLVYENEGSGSSADVLIKFQVTGLAYEVEGPKAQCGTSGNNGEYTGSSTEIAKNGKGEQIGWSVE